MSIKSFETAREWHTYLSRPEIEQVSREYGCRGTDSWTGRDSWETVKKKLLYGDAALVADAEKLMNKINAEIEVPERELISAPAGAYPVIPDYLAGSPTPMRTRVQQENTSSPIRIFASITSSASVAAEDNMKRGVAALSLAMALQTVRPVEMWIYMESKGRSARNGQPGDDVCLTKVKIGNSPLSLAHACHMLSNPSIQRKLMFAMYYEDTRRRDSIPWPNDHPLKSLTQVPPEHPYWAKIKRWLGAGPDDLVLGGEFSPNGAIFTDPVKWVQHEIDKHLRQQEENMIDV